MTISKNAALDCINVTLSLDCESASVLLCMYGKSSFVCKKFNVQGSKTLQYTFDQFCSMDEYRNLGDALCLAVSTSSIQTSKLRKSVPVKCVVDYNVKYKKEAPAVEYCYGQEGDVIDQEHAEEFDSILKALTAKHK